MKKIFTLALSAVALCASAQTAGTLLATTFMVRTQPVQQEGDAVYLMYFPNSFSSTPQTIETVDASKMTCTIAGSTENWIESAESGGSKTIGTCTGGTVKVNLRSGYPAGAAELVVGAGAFIWQDGSKTYTNSASITSNFEVTANAVVYEPQPVEVTLSNPDFFMSDVSGYERYIRFTMNPQALGTDSSKTPVLRDAAGVEYTRWAMPLQIANGYLTGELSADLPQGNYTLELPQGFLTYEKGDYSLATSVQFQYGATVGVAGIAEGETAVRRFTLQGTEIPAGSDFRGIAIEVRGGKASKVML